MLHLFVGALLALPQSGPAPSHTHGDMVGEVTASSAVVWTRADRSARVSCVVASRPDLVGGVTFGPVATNAGLTAQVPVTGLGPAAVWYFRTRLSDANNASLFEDGAVGTFRTPPAGAQPVTFTLATDVTDGPPGLIFPAMAALAPQFHVSLGDFPYCDGAFTLDDFRARHNSVRKGQDLVQFFRYVPCFAVPDDHEITNDWDSSTNPTLVANGRAAWLEWFPLAPLAPGQIYRSFSWGSAVRVILLDTRTYRGRNLDPDLPGRSLLGAAQMQWLKQELLAATETFVVVATTVPLRYGKTLKDHWEGYQRDREELFDFIARNQLRQVVFVAGDQHHGAFNLHREGLTEMVVGPARAFLAVPHEDREPEARVATLGLGFATVTVDPLATPPTLTLELRDANRVLARRVVARQTPGELRVLAGGGDAQVALDGPHFFLHRGAASRYDAVPPGSYSVSALDSNILPASALAPSVTVPAGGYAAVGVLPPVTAASQATLLLGEDFAQTGLGVPAGFTVVDEGTQLGPSAWFTDNGQLWQSGDIYSVDPPRPGSHVTAGSTAWTDQVVRVTVRPHGFLAHGVLFRYQDPANYYLFWQDLASPLRAVFRRRNDLVTLLAADNRAYPIQRTFVVECQALADQLAVRIDGETILTARDATLTQGKVGLAVWGSSLTAFANLRVWSAVPDDGLRLFDHFTTPGLPGWTVVDDGTQSAPSAWRQSNSRALQSSWIQGPGSHRPGSSLIRLTPALQDGVFSARLKNLDGNGVGVLFRVQSSNTYYRFHMDANQGFRRLDKMVGGVWSLLAEDRTQGYETQKMYRVDCTAQGDRLSVFLDGVVVLQARDASVTSGGIGLYTFASGTTTFDRAELHDLRGDLPITTVSGAGRQFQVDFHVPGAANDIGVVLMSMAHTPGIDLTGFEPAARLLPLRADSLLVMSMINNAWTTFDAQGHASHLLALPTDPGLAGFQFLVGGVRVTTTAAISPLASAPVLLR